MTPVSISVGISTLDRPDALARCLDALLAGELSPAEILVVDQGNVASTVEVIEARRGAGVAIIHIHQRARGLSASRNEMIRRASTEILAVTDDDCVPDAGWLSAVARAFAVEPIPDAVTGRVLALGPEVPGLYAISLRPGTVRVDFTRRTAPWLVGTGANFAAKVDRLRRLGGYDERLGAGSPGHAAEDLEICHRLLAIGGRIRYEPDAIVYHERQTRERRLVTRWSYAHGIGATCAMLLRRGEENAPAFLARWLADIAKRFVRATVRLDRDELHQAWLSLAGTIRGVLYGWREGGANPAGSDPPSPT